MWEKEEYGHAFIVFPLGLYWIASSIIKEKTDIDPSLILGLLVLTTGLSINVLGVFIVSAWLSHISIIVVISGFIITIFGFKYLTASWKGLMLIALVIPLPKQFMTLATSQLQISSSVLGTLILQTIQIPVYREGNVIDLGLLKLQVVEACSGLNYVMPLFCFSFLISFSLKLNFLVRTYILLITIPIAIIANAMRIALIGATATIWGKEAAEGILHELEGYAFFLICLLMLTGCFWLIIRFSGKKIDFKFSREWEMGGDYIRALNFQTKSVILIFLILSVTYFEKTWLLDRRTSIETSYDISIFPLSIGSWQGTQRSLSSEELNALSPSNYFMADYSFILGNTHPSVNMYVAYYSNTGQYNAPHSPLVCLPGSGWEVNTLDIYSFTPKGASYPFSVNRILMKKGDTTLLVYFWWKVGGRNVASTFSVKGRLLLDSIKSGRSDVALVRVVINVPNAQTITDQDAVLQNFVSDILQPLNSYIPSTDIDNY
jgi:exosortase D (VPLPA-CTERM-specific)